MTEPEAESKLASWTTPQISFEIEYRPAVLPEIAGSACAAMQESPKGDFEIGGVLFGTHEEGSIQIQTWRPIECQHTDGPSLRLLARDRVELACLLELARRSDDLDELQPVGWFVSHPRLGVRLSSSDLEIFNGFFPYPWQVTLALQPVAKGRLKAGFFAREAGGKLQTDSSYREFEIEPAQLPSPAETAPIFSWAENPPPPPAPVEHKRVGVAPTQDPPLFRQFSDVPAATAVADLPVTSSWKKVRPSSGWLWTIPVLLAFGVGALLIRERPAPRIESFPLHVSDARQTMQIEWDRSSPLMQGARAAVMDIRDGGKSTRYTLSADEIRAGTMSYARQSGDVDLVMTVYPPTGAAVQGSGRLVAPPSSPNEKLKDTPPPPPASDVTEVRAERDALRTQVSRLEESLRKDAAERNRLQDLVRILENRLNVGANSNPASAAQQDK